VSTNKIEISKTAIARFCRCWKVTEFALFGSALRSDLGPDSDVDVLVSFAPDARWTLLDMVDMQEELEGIFGRKVDLVTRRGIESSRNHIRRKAILSSAEVIHVA
jgi:hypothetical protein